MHSDRIRNRRRIGIVAVACGLLALAACSGSGPTLKRIKARGTLVVLTRNAPTTYYIGNEGQPTGPEYQMVLAFAKSIGVKPKFIVKDSVAELLAALANDEGDMIAAGITRTDARSKRFGFGPNYQQVTQQVVCRRGGPQPDSAADLKNISLKVIADSSYVERLKVLQKKYPDLHWETVDDTSTETLLREVWRGKLDCTVADSDIVTINRRFFPNLVVAFDLSEPQHLAWVVPQDAGGLETAMQRWLVQYRARGELAALRQRYYGHIKVFDYVDVRAFNRKIKSTWPKYQPLFDKAADAHDIPPLILAAQSYQESHWNPHAKSPTGVRGMMMLTLNTAHAMGVTNRMDPEASINGGAKYLARMEQQLNGDVERPARIWFALAAYNIGLFHLRDARALAKQLGKDPDSWNDMAQVLPLLGEKRYYRYLRYGYARGLEAVRYVRRIRNYADILRVKTATASLSRAVIPELATTYSTVIPGLPQGEPGTLPGIGTAPR
ncbi:MAG: membrane-bound lytic murein transglycosylase MltF [Gammaproteobacteria bacterium]